MFGLRLAIIKQFTADFLKKQLIAVFYKVLAHQCLLAFDAELFKDSLRVRFDRVFGYSQSSGNLSAGFPIEQELRDAFLLRR